MTVTFFCKFFTNPNFDLEISFISRKQRADVSDDTLSVPKYCKVFTHVSITFPTLKHIQKRHSNQIKGRDKNTKKSLLPLGDVNPIPRLTAFTTANDSWINLRNFTQLYNKVPVGSNGMPHIYPQNAPS